MLKGVTKAVSKPLTILFNRSLDESIFPGSWKIANVIPIIFIAGRPKAAHLFRFFGDFRCGALLFMVIHVIYKYKNR